MGVRSGFDGRRGLWGSRWAVIAVVGVVAVGGSPVAAETSPVVTQQDLVGPAGSGVFGRQVVVLSNGNYVVSDPGWDEGASVDVGAGYLYDGATDSLLAALKGSTAGDQVGSFGVTALSNGNYVASSPNWDNGATSNAGAVTLGVAAGGVSGTVSSSNSVIGTPPGSVFPPGDQLTSNDALPVPTTQSRVLLMRLDRSPFFVSTPPDVTAATAPGATDATVSFPTPVAQDLRSTPTVGCAPASGSMFAVGANTVTCTATDSAALAATTSFTVTVSATPPVDPPVSPPDAVSPSSPPPVPSFVALTPARILDTRGAARVGNAAGTGAPYVLNVAGQGGLPTTGIGAVALNVTVTQTDNPTIGGGYVTVYPCGTRPDASNLNFTTGQTIPNSVIAPVSATGDVCFYVYGTAHLLADVSGYFRTGFNSLTPARILDTRGAARVGNAAGTGAPYVLNVAGQGGLPTEVAADPRAGTGIGAVALNVTVTQTDNPTIGGGYVTVYPCGTRPDASNLNFTTGQTIPNSIIAPVSATGDVCFYVYGTAHLLADVSGYFRPGTGFNSLNPARILDTRGAARVGNAAGTGAPYVLNVAGQGGLPTDGIGAVALNVTVTQTDNPTIGGGYVTVYPCGTRPDASNLNFTTGQTIPNSVIAPVSPTGDICFYVYGTAHLLADVSGYVRF